MPSRPTAVPPGATRSGRHATPTPEQARRVFYALTLTRWFPVGFVVGLFILWAFELGLSTTQALAAMSAIGFAVALLELPTSGFTDVLGRRPVYLAAAVVQVAAALAYATAGSWGAYLAAGVLMGIFRALESGPLEAWFVDAVHVEEPGADVDQPLARAGTLIGASMAVGSLLSGALVWWHPFESRSALELPMTLYVVGAVVHLVAVAALMHEVPHLHSDAATPELAEAGQGQPKGAGQWQRVRASVAATPSVIASGLGILRTSAALRGLVLASGVTAIVMVVQENFVPIRLAEMLGSNATAGAWMGPVAAFAWGAFSAGSAAVGLLARRVGVARAAIIGRGLHALGSLLIGVVTGPVALVAVYLLTYGVFGSGAMDRALTHRVATAANRATVLSLASLVSFLAFAIAAPLLGLLAERTSSSTAVVVAALTGLLALPCYLPALRAERVRDGQGRGGSAHSDTVGP